MKLLISVGMIFGVVGTIAFSVSAIAPTEAIVNTQENCDDDKNDILCPRVTSFLP